MPAGTWNHPDASDSSETQYTDDTTYGIDMAPIASMFMQAFRQRGQVCYYQQGHPYSVGPQPWPNLNQIVGPLAGFPFKPPVSSDIDNFVSSESLIFDFANSGR